MDMSVLRRHVRNSVLGIHRGPPPILLAKVRDPKETGNTGVCGRGWEDWSFWTDRRVQYVGGCSLVSYPSIPLMKPSQPQKHGKLGKHFCFGWPCSQTCALLQGRTVTFWLWISEHGTWYKKKFLISSEVWSIKYHVQTNKQTEKKIFYFKAKTLLYSLAA